MKRRTFLATLPTAALSAAAPPPRPATSRPNLIFLLCDDLQAFVPGFSGNREFKTPNLDRLASQGVVFDRCYANSAICMPARATAMTGLYEYRHGCNFGRPGLSPEAWRNRSYPMLLKRAGYRIAFAGKWGMQFREPYDPSADFDRWGGLEGGQGFYETAKNPAMKSYADRFPHVTRALGAFAADFIGASISDPRPFCLSLSFKAPHKPHNRVDPADAKLYENAAFSKRPNYGDPFFERLPPQPGLGRQRAQWPEWDPTHYQEHLRAYAALVSGIDAAVCMIVEKLDALGLRDNTVIVFTSDNGYALGSHGFQGKALPYEEQSRIPLFVVDPHGAKGRRCDRLVAGIDFAPTLLDYAGLPAPAGTDGKSLRSLVRDPAAPAPHAAIPIFQNWGPARSDLNKGLAVVTERYKYVYWPYGNPDVPPAEELYDLRADPCETDELLRADKASPETLEEMRKLYDRVVLDIAARPSRGYETLAKLYDRHLPWNEKSFNGPDGRFLTPELYRRVVGKEPPEGLFPDRKKKRKKTLAP